MSIKTSKRIALGVIASLVFAPFAAIAPASAAGITAINGAGSTQQAGVVGNLVTFTLGNIADNTADSLAVRVAGPAAGTLVVTGVASGTDNRTLTSANTVAPTNLGATSSALTLQDTDDVGAKEWANGSATLKGYFTAPGVYTISLGDTAGVLNTNYTTATVTVLPGSDNTTSLTASNDKTVYVAGTDAPVVTISRNAGGSAADGQILLRVDETASATAITVNTILGDGLETKAEIAAVSGGVSFTFPTSVFTSARTGTYKFTAFNDRNGNGSLDAGEVSTTASFTIAGAGDDATATSTLSADTTSVINGVNVITFIAAAFDADDLKTRLVPATAVLYESEDLVASVGLKASPTTLASLNAIEIGSSGDFRFQLTTQSLAKTSSVFTLDLDGNTATTGDQSTVTISNRTQATANATMMVEAQTGILAATAAGANAGTAPAAASAAGVDLSFDTTVATAYFKIGSTASSYVLVKAVAGPTTSQTRISGGTVAGTQYLVGADGFVIVGITLTSPVDGDSYVLTADVATGTDAVYNVYYNEAEFAWTISPATGLKVLNGASTTYKGVLKDTYGRIQASKAVTATVTGRNPATASLTTDATGAVEYSVKDAYTGTVLLTDTVTFSYPYVTAAGTAASKAGSVVLNYVASLTAVGTVAVTSPTAVKVIDQVEEISGSPVGSTVTYTATVRSTTGASIGSGYPVTWTIGANDVLLSTSSLSSVTGAAGTASITVFRRAIGYATVSATAGGVSATAQPILWVNGNADGAGSTQGDHRNIKVSAAQTIVPGSAATVVANVTDRWNNPVSGVRVTFTLTGAGRLVAGDTTIKYTDINGNAQVQVTSLSTESGTNTITATIAGGQSADLAGFVKPATTVSTAGLASVQATTATAVTGVTAGNATASSTVTFAAPPVPEVVVPPVAPTLKGSLNGRVLLFGSCMADEGDMIIYVKRPGGAWNEKAKTLECVAGEFDGSLRAPKNYPKYYRVKQEGTGLWSSSVLIRP